MADSRTARFDLRLVGVGIGALIVAVVLIGLPLLFASTQPNRAGAETTSTP
jgi:hypothetical protein